MQTDQSSMGTHANLIPAQIVHGEAKATVGLHMCTGLCELSLLNNAI